MHEMSLAEGIRRIVEDALVDEPAARVSSIVLELGELAAVECEALLFSLEVVLRDSVAEGASIEIERVPGRGWCLPCGTGVALQRLYDACPHCGSHQVQPTGGTEMRVKALEVRD